VTGCHAQSKPFPYKGMNTTTNLKKLYDVIGDSRVCIKSKTYNKE
jgi:hypothetical protein